MPDLYSEIRDEVAQESLLNFFKKYGKLLAIIAIFIILAIAGNKTYKFFENKKITKTSDQYFVAEELLAKNDKDKAIAELDAVINNGYGNFKYVAGFRKAEILIGENKLDEAIEIYDKISNAKDADVSLKDLAALFLVHKLSETGKKEDGRVAIKLAEITKVGRPFRYNALEIKGQLELDKGNKEGAKEIFLALKNDIATPESTRARAKEIYQLINQ